MRSTAAIVALLLCAWMPPSHAQTFPTHTIRLVVPFAPGGGADTLARPIAQKLGTALNQAVVVENRPGAQTIIAAELVAKAAPDGYTLYVMPGAHVLLPFIMRKLPFDPIADFTPIALLGTQPYVIVAFPNLPFTTMKDMIAYAKANPGKLAIGVSDPVTQAAAESLKALAGIDITVANYKGGGPLMNDLLGGQIALGLLTPGVYMPFEKDQKMRALAVSVPQRLSFLPDVPTVIESAGVREYDIKTWYSIVGPARMPPATVALLQRALHDVFTDADIHQRLVSQGIEPASDTSAAAASALMKPYMEHMGKLIRQAGIEPQ